MRSTGAANPWRPRTGSPTKAYRSTRASRSAPPTTWAISGICTTASIPAARCIRAGRPGSRPIPTSRCASSAARRASGRSSLGLRRAAFAALLAIGAGSLLFDLTLPFRLPSDSDWAEASGALRAGARPGDAVQIWPPWAERARLFVDAPPVAVEEDLERADFVGVQRLWVLSLPRAPWFSSPEAALRARGAVPVAAGQRYRALALQAWGLGGAPGAADLTRSAEEHEVDYIARRCVRVLAGGRFSARGAAGATLHVRAGVIGERADDLDRPDCVVQIFADGAPVGSVEVPRTARDGTGWRRLDVPLPAGEAEREFVFAAASLDRGTPLCLQAWTSR